MSDVIVSPNVWSVELQQNVTQVTVTPGIINANAASISDISAANARIDTVSVATQSISVASISASQQLGVVDYVSYNGSNGQVLTLPLANALYPRGVSVTIKNLTPYSVTISAQSGNNIEGYDAFIIPTKNTFAFNSDSISTYGII